MSFFEPPRYGIGGGIGTEFGTLIPPGAAVAGYVRSTGPQSQDHPDVKGNLYTTLNQALAKCRSGFNDFVFVLPGHVENVSSAAYFSNLVAGTNIIGTGIGAARPTFTWTTATSTWLMNKANVRVSNCILNMDPGSGSVNVAAPMTISAAGCVLSGCQVRMGTDVNSTVTIGITTTAGATDLTLQDMEIYGAVASVPTTMIQFVGAVRSKFLRSTVRGGTSAAGVGVVRFLTTASTGILWDQMVVVNGVASSTAAVTGMAGNDGNVRNTQLSVLSGGLVAWGTPANITFDNVRASNALGGQGALSPAIQTLS